MEPPPKEPATANALTACFLLSLRAPHPRKRIQMVPAV